MTDETGSLNLSLHEFSEEGLYLILPDRSRIAITHEKVEQFAAQFLEDPAKVPLSVKKAVDFQACSICPRRHTGEFCHALRPTLPFLEITDRYVSFDKVIAVFREGDHGLFHVKHTTMQKALQHVSILSLIHYCEMGRKYLRYFLGVMPLMEMKEVAERIFLNIFWNCRGDVEKIKEIVTRFVEEIRITSACQIKRLNTICKSDPFLNAFAVTQAATELVSMMNDEVLEKSFNEFEKK